MNNLGNWADAPAPSRSKFFRFEEGKNTFRILESQPRQMWEFWVTDEDGVRPVRVRTEPTTDELAQYPEAKDVRPVTITTVYDYEGEQVALLSIHQKTILGKLAEIVNKWGAPTGYDIDVIKKVNGSRTTYEVVNHPPSELAESAKAEVANTDVDYEKLFIGEDPFI